MKRTVYLNLAGKNYPLNFSLGACKVITKELGSLEKMEEALSEGLDSDTIDKIILILQVLIAQGCAYKNLFEIDAGIPVDVENPALNEEGRFKALSKEEIEMLIGFDDIDNIVQAIGACVGTSTEQEVEAKAPKNESAPGEE